MHNVRSDDIYRLVRIFRGKISEAVSGRSFRACWTNFARRHSSLSGSLDRLACSTRDLLETIETMRDAGARFQSLSEPWADAKTHAGKMFRAASDSRT
jgi:hypothetical protein